MTRSPSSFWTRRIVALTACACACACVVAACGHDTSSNIPVPSNGVALSANAGPPNIGYVDGLFTSVTVCVPGTTQCQTIDSVLVDTGSIGLRVLSSVAGGAFSLPLPEQVDGSGNPIVECNGFVDSYTWGAVRLADITMGGEKAANAPIQVIGDASFPDIPTSCSSGGGPNADTLASLGANAILGVGGLPQDCGAVCAESLALPNSENPGNIYFICPASGCEPASVAVDLQVQNPVSLLPVDNNGVIVDLSSLSASGAPSGSGTLYFGIGTQANNSLGSATVLTLDPEALTFSTEYLGQTYPMSFIDSGSNGLYFLSSGVASLAMCTDMATGDYYCPTTTVSLSATNEGMNGASSVVTFQVANADTLFADSSNYDFNDLAGPSTGGEYFDWGLPFFFGRKVFSSIAGSTAPGGATPYVAY